MSACDGERKLPGTWKASHEPGASRPSQSPISRAWSGTHWKAALLTTTSTPGSGRQPAISARTNRRLVGASERDRARSIIAGELSRPMMSALGHRSARVAVSVPGPQPRSMTRFGATAPMRPTRSKNGRSRWCRNSVYLPGSHRTGAAFPCEASLVPAGHW